MKHKLSLIFLLPLISLTHVAYAEESGLSGDIGLAITSTQAIVTGVKNDLGAMPYLNFEYGRAFARVDSLGVKVLPFGYGNLEVLGQYRADGYHSSVVSSRQGSIPLGLGTLQITPIGAFDVHALHDFGKSGGDIVQARYLAEIPFGRTKAYPELGVEYESSAYTGYYYGTTASDAVTLGRGYTPGAAVNTFAGLLLKTQISGNWYATTYFRCTWLDSRISGSPIVTRGVQKSLMFSVLYQF